jgi:ATP-dependent helicase HrpB
MNVTLPVDAVIPELLTALREKGAVVVAAPPGSGKSTRVPPALLGVVSGQVLLLQPRRLAARALARRIADERGGNLGEEVGYQVRFDRVGSPRTRLWVMTEGLLTRRLTEDPYLEGVDAVVLDEVHERSIHTDACLAYLAELRRTLRPELKLVAMSATMDHQRLAAFLDAAVIDAPGRTYPVMVRHQPVLPGQRPHEAMATAVAQAVVAAVRDADGGDVLVFLPGMGEIRHSERAVLDAFAREGISEDAAEVVPLHGSLPPEQQDRALAPRPPGAPRLVVLSTNVAETSVTIPGVRTVIDTATARVLRCNPATGLDELRLEPISVASAVQRAGRAGRTAPGQAIRLATPLMDSSREAFTDPEVRRIDLAPLVLILKRWGYHDVATFPWFEAPEPARLVAATALLSELGACAGPAGALTPLGEDLAQLPVHPRIGRMLRDAARDGEPALGAALAAVIGEREIRLRDAPPADPQAADAMDRLRLLQEAEAARFSLSLRSRGIDPGAAREAAQVRRDLERLARELSPGKAGLSPAAKGAAESSGPVSLADRRAAAEAQDRHVVRLLLAAHPDRVAKRTAPDSNRAMMVGGIAVELDGGSAVAAAKGRPRPELLLAISLTAVGGGTMQVRQAAELTTEDIEAVFPGRIERRTRLWWDAARGRVEAQVGHWYRDLAIRMVAGAQADPGEVATFLARELSADIETIIKADAAAADLLARWRWLHAAAPDLAMRHGIPAPPDATALAALLPQWCAGHRTRDDVLARAKVDSLQAEWPWAARQALDDLAPSHLPVPTGNRIRLDYQDADAERPPVLAVRLQELFGEAATPRLAEGRIPVLLHLLGPNYRCEQITRDLAGFWATTYPQVRKDLRGRYPKHSWPDNPLTALPVAKGRPRQG